MNWEAIQAVAELTAAFGVLLSLGYLAIQVRQNTASVQAGTVARASEALNRVRNLAWSDPDAGHIYSLATSGEPVTDPELGIRVRLFWVTLAREYEAVFYEYRAGQLPEAMWVGWSQEMVMIFDTPGGRDALSGMGFLLSPIFTQFVEDQLRAEDRPTLADVREAWSEGTKRRRVRELDEGSSAGAI